MNADLYEQFVSLKNLGKKAAAKAALDLFIASFETWEEKQVWVFSFLGAEKYGHRIRHEIYEELVYPVLLDGYLKNDARSVVWLAKTARSLYRVKSAHPSLKNKHEFILFREAYSLEPTEEIGARLLDTFISWFSYAKHEWPAGILYGTDGADVGQCEEYLQEIQFARSLDRHNKHESFLFEFEAKVHEYIQRLRQSA